MDYLWSSITGPQATIISTLLTVLAAGAGVVLGGWIFGGRVKDLKGALDESKKLIGDHELSVGTKLSGILKKFEEVETQLSSNLEGIGQLRGSIGDLQSASVPNDAEPAQINARERIRSDWTAVRDSLERMAVDPTIDGRTRARYARIDRRSYADLLHALDEDWDDFDPKPYGRAIAIWNKYKNGKLTPTSQDMSEMEAARRAIEKK